MEVYDEDLEPLRDVAAQIPEIYVSGDRRRARLKRFKAKPAR
jgi:hypothetical protein